MCQNLSLSLFYLDETFLIYMMTFLNWNRKILRWEKGNMQYTVSKIDENQCRINTIYLTEGELEWGGGVLLQSRCEDCNEIFLQTVFSDFIYSVAYRSCCNVISKATTILLRRGGGSVHFNSTELWQIFLINRWPFSFNREGFDKTCPLIYREGNERGCPIPQKRLSITKAPM